MPITISSDTRPPLFITASALRPISRAGLHSCAQHVAGGELNETAALGKAFGLRALAGSGRPQKNKLHRPPRVDAPRSFAFLIRPSYWWASKWLWIWATVSMVTLTAMSSDVPPK